MKSHHAANCLARNVRSIRPLACLAFAILTSVLAATTIQGQTIEFDSASGAGDFDSIGTRTSLTWSHTITNKTNRILIVGVSTSVNAAVGPNADRVISVTYDGQGLTKVGSLRSPLPGTRSSTEMFRLVAPPVGTANVVVTLAAFAPLSNYAVGGSVSFTGVDQTTPHGVFVSNSGTNDSPTLVVTSAAGELIIDNVATTPDAGTLAPIPGNGQTQRYNGIDFIDTDPGPPGIQPGLISVGAGSTKPAASPVTMSWQSSSSGDWAIGAISLRPSPLPTAAPAIISGQVTTRDGNPLGGVTVTLSGAKTDQAITNSDGHYSFTDVETDGFYSVAPSRANYSFNPRERSFSLIANKTDAIFTAEPTAETANPLDTTEFFVRQQYLDFLGREPDQRGFEYWNAQLRQCGDNAECLKARRIGVSGAFFAETEFQQTGSYIYRLYQGALGRQLSYQEFSNDRGRVIGGPNLNQEKVAFAEEFVRRAEFIEQYGPNSTADSFVQALLLTIQQSAGVNLSNDRDALIAMYQSGSDMNKSRSLVLTAAIDDAAFQLASYDASFVLMQYFGYLKRDPDRAGYDFWLNVLKVRERGNYRGMVCAFLTSAEYQQRFSSIVTQTNVECGH